MSAYIMLYELKTTKVNTYIKHIFGKVDLLSLHATLNCFIWIALKASKRQRHTYLSDTGNTVEI